eukprot:CAMPEP_0184698996 /NCGR_PEP_ID=MMETSP0313-20130426/5415_1 /TAXON_ID=2792 /ORGANISM="Porphyridium aerugineum, Strain SAG 1380-2" /LENGTH=46 /DNA_ID= /DNA_START= /DNA_END= /DNA_ORIENTATION=
MGGTVSDGNPETGWDMPVGCEYGGGYGKDMMDTPGMGGGLANGPDI